MSTNALQFPSPTTAPAVSSALRELLQATANLAAAVYATLFKTAAPQALTAFEEAEQVRQLAESYTDSDPGFASDLFAAADRHEVLHRAQ